MWHPIERVADSQFLDHDITRLVADTLGQFFGIHDGQISTWNVDAFVAAVKRIQGDETDAIRKREILRQYPDSTLMS